MLDTLGDYIAPYRATIGAFAGTVTSLQFLSGVFFLNDIRKKGSADGFPATPFLGGIVLSILSLKFGALLKDNAMISTNFIGFVINVIYMIIFFFILRTNVSLKVWTKVVATSLFIVGSFIYAKYENPEVLEFRFGMLITTVIMGLVGSPFLALGEVIRTKSTEKLPFPFILAGSIVASSWMLYGISIKNAVFVFQKAFLLFLCVIQLSLFVIYPASSKEKLSSKKD